MSRSSPHPSPPTSPAVPIEELEALRVPLTGYCYRLLGAAADADDAVQETLVRASRHLDRYDPARARLTTWVHRIATNVCLDLLRHARRRALVVAGPAPAPGPEGLGAPLPADRWVEPIPDHRVIGAAGTAGSSGTVTSADPADVVARREHIRLAFVAALQRLAPRPRAVLVLRDVLGFSAAETAGILDTTTAAVNSALQRARATLAADPPDPADVLLPDDPAQQDLVRRYVAAFETHDVDGLTRLLRRDAVASMPPFAWQVQGAARIAGLMTRNDACAGDRLRPTVINGSVGFGQYRPDADGVLRPFALILVELRQGRIAHLVTFLGTGDRFAEFGLPERYEPPSPGWSPTWSPG